MNKSNLELLLKEKKVTKKELFEGIGICKPYFDKLLKTPFKFGVDDFIFIANKLGMSGRTLESTLQDRSEVEKRTGWDEKPASLE